MVLELKISSLDFINDEVSGSLLDIDPDQATIEIRQSFIDFFKKQLLHIDKYLTNKT